MSLKARQFFGSSRARRIALIALLGLIAWSLVAWVAARNLMVNAELPHADVLVVLAGSTAYAERTRRAAELYHEGRAPKIVLTNDNQQSGWSNALQRNPFFVERAVEELSAARVPASVIEILPQAVSSTYDEAQLLRRYAETNGLRSILIVTSAYHSRRALWTFRKVFEGSGVNIGLTFAAPGEQTPSPSLWWLRLSGWKAVAGEYVKLIYYRVHYR